MSQKIFFGTMVILLMVLMANPALSQSKQQKFGLRGGINLAKTTTEGGKFVIPIDGGTEGEASVQIKNRTTFGFGGFWEYPISPAIAIQVNALYNRKGERENLQFSGSFSDSLIGETVNFSGNIEVPLELTYLSLPVMGKYSFGKEGSARPYLMAGPEIGFLLSSGVGNVDGTFNLSIPALGISETVNIGEIAGELERDLEDQLKDVFESVEFSLNFGAGLTFPLGKINGFIDGRYGLGLSNIYKQGDNKAKNTVIYVNGGLIF